MASHKKIIIPWTDNLEYKIPIPEKKEDVLGWNLPKKDQKWRRIPTPNFSLMNEDEKKLFFERELERLVTGVHFMNNGNVEYITGNHYWFLQHWNLGGGKYPKFFNWHKNLAYLLDLCRKDPDCFGAQVLASKRGGKSEFVPCEFLSDAMLQEVAGYIIQAQNDTKSKKLFRRTLRAFQAQKRSLPYSYQHFTTQNEILFKNALANKKTTKKVTKDDVAESDHVSIGAYPSKIDFIQGETTRGIFMDEYCSQEQMDMEEWMDTAIAQCSEGIGKKIIGKIWLIATPERAKSKSLPFAEKLFENSDPSKRNENNRTVSGLYRMLVPYYESTPDFMDEYGYSDVEAAKKFFANMCEGKSADKVRELKRKYISCKEDAFDIDFGGGIEADCAEILRNRLEALKRENPPVYRAVLYEENGQVMFKPTKIPEKDIEMEDEAVRIFEAPKKGCLYRIGVDGTATDKETSTTQDSKKSKYSVTVTKLFDPDPHSSSYCDVAEFVIRPEKMDECYRVTAYLSRLYNIDNKCRVLPEGNAGNAAPIVGFFRNKSLLQLMLKQPKYAGTDSNEVFDRYCFYRDGNVRKTQLDLLNVAIRMYGHGFNSRRLILDILRLGKFNTDLADSFQAAILSWGGFSEPPKPKKEPEKQKIMQFNREEGIFEEVEI
jgi:hypothetical protein